MEEQEQQHHSQQVKKALSEVLEEYCARSVVGQDSVVTIGDAVWRASDMLSVLGIPFARTASGDLDLKIGVGLGNVLQMEGEIFTQHTWSVWKETTKFRVRMTLGEEEAAKILRELE